MDLLKRIRYLLFPPRFTVRVNGGTVRLVRGRVTPSFLRDCQALVSESGIRDGWIRGTGGPGNPRLDFSSGIGEKDRQRFRNVAGMHR